MSSLNIDQTIELVFLYKHKIDGTLYAVKKLQLQRQCDREMQMLRVIHKEESYALFVKMHLALHYNDEYYIVMGKHIIIILHIDHYIIVIRCFQ